MSTLVGVNSQYSSQVLIPHLMADNNLTLLAAKSTQVPQAERVVIRNEERGATGGMSLNITSHSSSTSSGFVSIDLTQEMLDEKGREKLRGKIK